MKLLCVRHGHAETVPDNNGDRHLTAIGVQEVTRVADYIAKRGTHVAHILNSNKVRAIETARIFAEHIMGSQESEYSEMLDLSKPVRPLVEAVNSWTDDTMLVGHMPFVSQLVSTLVLGDEYHEIFRFPPATVVCLERRSHDRWLVDWVVRPELVARLEA